MAYKADCAVVLALLKVAFLGKGDDKRSRLGPWYGPLSRLPNRITDFMQYNIIRAIKCKDVLEFLC